jgi:predicted dehydrogenase
VRQLGVGVIGVGMLGRRHAANIARLIPAARLVAVADVRAEAAKAVADDLGAPRWYLTADELAADPDVEAIVITSIDSAHAAGILAAATNRKPVFCEKPITTNLADADRVIAAVEQAGVQLQIGFMRRYDAAYVAAKREIDAGTIGTPIFFKNAHRGMHPEGEPRPLADGPDPAVFFNSSIHDYDNARWLLGDEAIEVTAVATRVVAPTAGNQHGVDASVATVRFRNGGLGDIENVSSTQYGYDVRTEVIGDRGTLFIGSPKLAGLMIATGEGVRQAAVDHWLTRFGQAYLIEIEDWVRRTLAGEPSYVTGADGRAALAIAMAATKSYETGRPVQIDGL